MTAKTVLKTAFAGVILFLFALPQAFAEQVSLQPGEMPGAQGTAEIQDVGNGLKEVDITVEGLRPGEVYTVWLVSEGIIRMDMEGLGEPAYNFETDEQGNASYTATIPEEELAEWDDIRIAYHPDRNPRNMDNIIIDLQAELQ